MFSRLLLLGLAASSAIASDGFVKMDFDVMKGQDFSSAWKNYVRTLDTRADTEVDLGNEKSFYVTTITMGSQLSEVKILLDTGSADLWVTSTTNSKCEANGGDVDCEQYGTFNETASSTWKSNDTAFSISYADSTYASGTYGQDDISFSSSLAIKDANFAVADDTDSNVGVFGVSYSDLESASPTYANIPVQMQQQGLIQTVGYSLYLTGAEASTGSILFGAVDNAKYSGDLVSFDVTKQDGSYVYLQIPLTKIGIDITSNSTENTSNSTEELSAKTRSVDRSSRSFVDWINSLGGNSKSDSGSDSDSSNSTQDSVTINSDYAILDSGTTLTYLSQDAVDSIINIIQPGATYSSSLGGYSVSCTLRQEGNSMSFDFDDKKTIVAPLSDIIILAGDNATTGDAQCVLGILPGDNLILGDNFLRSAYSVFNLQEKTISLAQMKYTEDTDVQVL